MFNILNYFLKAFKAHGFTIVFVKQHFFPTKLWILQNVNGSMMKSMTNAINCMKSRTPLLPNSWKLFNLLKNSMFVPMWRRYELWTLISQVEMWLVLMVLTFKHWKSFKGCDPIWHFKWLLWWETSFGLNNYS
jgi:hypothetical protein